MEAKNPDTIKFTKVKGHATEQMVQDGEVVPEDKEGNDEADATAEKGVRTEQEDLNYMRWKYAARMKAYTRVMTQVHNFIIEVRKVHNKMMESCKRLEDPF